MTPGQMGMSRLEGSLALLRCLNGARAKHDERAKTMYEAALEEHDWESRYSRRMRVQVLQPGERR